METILNMQEEPILKGIVENLKALTPEEQRDIDIFIQAYKLLARRTGKPVTESA